MSMLKKLVGPVQRQGAAQALKELEDEGRSWPMNHDSEVEHVVEHEVKDEDSEVGDCNSEERRGKGECGKEG